MTRIFKNRKGQNTAEYAILIALVVGGVIAMQTYAQRALQGRLRDASVTMRDQTDVLGNSLQYEPYYSKSESESSRTSTKTEDSAGMTESTNVIKAAGATDNTTWTAGTTVGRTGDQAAW
jgi:Flp pilus assembly pilin Flp